MSEDGKSDDQKRKRKGTGQGKGAYSSSHRPAGEMRLGDEALSWQDTPAADAHPVRRLLRSQARDLPISTPPPAWMLHASTMPANGKANERNLKLTIKRLIIKIPGKE